MKPRIIGDGFLMIPYGITEEQFNQVYKGYYPPCRFSALSEMNGIWYAAGNDGAGLPHLFSSESGTVWTEMNIKASFGGILPGEYGIIIGIFPGELAGELYLIGNAGVAVSVPDCPYCVEAVRFSDEPVSEVRREADRIFWKTSGEEEKSAPLKDLIRHRVSWEWVRKHRAVVLYLYAAEETEPLRIPGVVSLPESAFDRFIRSVPREICLAVMHTDSGAADSAAARARKAGLSSCRSMGGIREALFAASDEKEP